ncbi:hypothetical protein STSP2_01547 [Anaerohalosphaera lusitana]|uniref:Uncharacterized protein n=1 Tax=Anaerohalosphaera lusitana TaxID=1936003 RepID=A0A1U9NKR0_9BACT|nr:hypothetical protein [Anaerohalosphaera lusitana]AQT68387.1 hypothetical protein STSP2_01547 [Anaerohalosphaera lusitana]
MFSSLAIILGSFTSPMSIKMDPASLLWMFPLLAAIAIVYKATKMRVLFPAKFIKEVVVLFLTLSVFIVLAGAGLHVIVHFITT